MAPRRKVAAIEMWEPLIGETAKAFAAFVVYRDLGPTRSLKKAAAEAGRSYQLYERWSIANHWVLRARAWDAERDRLLRLGELDGIREMGKRQAAAGIAALSKVMARIETLDPAQIRACDVPRWLEASVKVERAARGEPTIDPMSPAPVDVPEAAEADDDLTRLAAIANVLIEAGLIGAGAPSDSADAPA